MSYYFGTSAALDGYWVALSIVFLFSFFGHPIREALVPNFHALAREDNRAAAGYFTQALLLAMLASMIGVCAMLAKPEALVRWVLPTAANAQIQNSALANTQLLGVAVPLYVASEIANGLLSSYGKLMWQQAARLLPPLSMLIAIFLTASQFGAMSVALGFVAGQALTVAIQLYVLWQGGLRPRYERRLFLNRSFLDMAVALCLTYALAQLYSVFEKRVYSDFGQGWISAFQYAVNLVNAMISVLGVTIANVLYVRFLEHAVSGNRLAIWKSTMTGCRYVFALLSWLTAVVFVLAPDIVALIYGRGAFDADAKTKTSAALALAVWAAAPISTTGLIVRALVALRANRSIAAISIAMTLCGALALCIAQISRIVELAMAHWALANIIGLLASLLLFKNLCQVQTRAAWQELFWWIRVLVSVALATTAICAVSWPQWDSGSLIGALVKGSAVTLLAVIAAALMGIRLPRRSPA